MQQIPETIRLFAKQGQFTSIAMQTILFEISNWLEKFCSAVKPRISKFIILSSILISSLYSTGQEQFVEPASRLITSFGFKSLTGGVIMLKAQLDKYNDTLNFILDTGSGGISLDSVTVENFGITPTPTELTILGIAGIRKVSFVYNQTLKLPGLTIDSLNFHVNNYDILTSVYGEKIDGIIGYSVLSRYIFQINYDSSRVMVFSNGRFRYPKGGWLYEPILRTLPVQTARVKDARTVYSRFLFDIGAGLCLMLNKDFVEDSSLLNKKRHLYTKEAEGVGGKVDMHLTVVREVRLGPYKFRMVPTFVFEDKFNLTAYPFLGGIIGNDILRRFNLILNYAKREFYLTPNSHYNEPFDYTYSGIELYYVDDKIILGDVADGSPAALAGLKEGDIVVGINKVFTQNLQLFKQALQTPGEKIKMIISRDGELMEFSFKLKNIL